MSRQRYEPVPQHNEIIILDSIHSPSYNYNSGIPNSVASSIRTPSVSPYQQGTPPSYAPSPIAPSIHSIPSSPPPSFHTRSASGTPRPTPSTTASADYAELWGVAPSTAGAPTEGGRDTEICAGSEALATIANLRIRVERLEESIGRLLLEKEQMQPIADGKHRENCCVTFTDASSSLEQALAASGSNCCVRFTSTKVDAKREKERNSLIGVLCILLIVCAMIVGIVTVQQGHKDCRGKGCTLEVDFDER